MEEGARDWVMKTNFKIKKINYIFSVCLCVYTLDFLRASLCRFQSDGIFSFLDYFETESCYVAQAGLKPVAIPLPQLPKD